MKLNWAERWVVNNPLRVLQQQIEIRMLKRMASLASGAKILEVGCGRGAGARLILTEFRPALLHASDLDIAMIHKAKGYLSPEQKKRTFLFVGDAARIPYKDNIMDAVFAFGVLHHVLDWRAALADIARVLKNNGLLFFEELYPPLYQNFITRRILLHPQQGRFRSDDLKAALKSLNLSIIQALDLKKVGILGASVKRS